jgi:hypothetical protein
MDMKITSVKTTMAIAALLGGSLCTAIANAGAETNKLIEQVGVHVTLGPYIVVSNAGDSQECGTFNLISIPEGFRSTVMDMLIAAKTAGNPVSLQYQVNGQGACVLTQLQLYP